MLRALAADANNEEHVAALEEQLREQSRQLEVCVHNLGVRASPWFECIVCAIRS